MICIGVVVRHKGDFSKTKKFLSKAQQRDYLKNLDKYAQKGVQALSAATPTDTGKTANSWTYEIVRTSNSVEIHWINTNEVRGINIAYILQLGHGTGTGGYVQGIDYINPAMKPIFDEIEIGIWKEVTSK